MLAVLMITETRLGCLNRVTRSFSRSFCRWRCWFYLSRLSSASHSLCFQPSLNQSSLHSLGILTLVQSPLLFRRLLLLLPRRFQSWEAVHWMLRYRWEYQLVMKEMKKIRIRYFDGQDQRHFLKDPKWDQNGQFTPQKDMTNIPRPFHLDSENQNESD